MHLSYAKGSWVRRNTKNKVSLLNKKTIKKICVIKHAAYGDLILSRPMLVTLREFFPDAKITLAVIGHYMRGIPYDLIDEVHITKGKGSSKKDVLASLKTLDAQDILFDISGSSRSMLLSFFTDAGLKIGYIHKGLHRLFYDIAIPRSHYRFESETFSEQLNPLGITYDWPPRYNFPKLKPIIEKDYIVYFTTASGLKKSWPKECFIEAIRNTIKNHPNYTHVLLTGIADWEIDIAKEIKSSITDECLIVQSGGDDTESIIANAKLLVTNDTGIRNLAIGYYTPTVGIFSNTAVSFGYTPYFGNHKVITPEGKTPAKVDSVILAIDDLLKNKL